MVLPGDNVPTYENRAGRPPEWAHIAAAAPEMTVSASRAALFRLVAEGPVAILFDEVDTIFRAKTGGSNEDLRAMLNAGYKRSATIPRYDARTRTVQRFPVYTPAALAGIAGGMPATITTRAITIHMRRRRPDQQVEPFRERAVEHEARPIRTALARWMNAVADQVVTAEPAMPDGVTDRAAEIWEPLIAIADAAGGDWPGTARAACRHFVLTARPRGESGLRLLADIRDVFGKVGTDRMPSRDLLAHLLTIDEACWADLPGRPLNARQLARRLRRYGVRPVTFSVPAATCKGYVTFPTTGKQAQAGLADAWRRYLPAIGNAETTGNPPDQPATERCQVTAPPVTDLRAEQPVSSATDTPLTEITATAGRHDD